MVIWQMTDENKQEFERFKEKEADINNCVEGFHRDIYKGGFPNCAATVEDGSWCGTNDACVTTAIVYKGMEECSFSNCNKAWK